MIIKMIIYLKVDDNLYSFDEDEKLWLENEILVGDGSLILHSNEVGDEVGIVKKVKNIEYIENDKVCPRCSSEYMMIHQFDDRYKICMSCKYNWKA